jgi:hypothetical protein
VARRKPSKDEDAATTARLRALLAAPAGRLLVRGGAVALAFLVLGVIVRQARAHAFALPAYRAGVRTLAFADLPEWADPTMLRALHDPRRLRLSVSVFDPRAEERVRAVVSAHPMVREVRSVALEYPNRVTVRARLRVPAAEVEAPDGSRRLLSDDRRLLEREPYGVWLSRVAVPLPLVVGVRARPPGVGEAWEDREDQVAEALAAAVVAVRLHRDLHGRVVVRKIDVGRYPARPEERAEGEIRFLLADGRVVEWGRTERDPGETTEEPYATKLRRLEAHFTEDDLKGRKRIDVRYRMKFEARPRAP